jgi:hypothetical protein
MWRRGRDEERNHWHFRATGEEGDARRIKETRNERRGRGNGMEIEGRRISFLDKRIETGEE